MTRKSIGKKASQSFLHFQLKDVTNTKMKQIKNVKQAKKVLTELSHTYIRHRDSVDSNIIAGNCFTCSKWCEGGNFQAGHFEPDSTGGVLLRYHPLNMHGQGGYCCNINRHGQQRIANEYFARMVKKYGLKYVEKLRALKNKKDAIGMPYKADLSFFLKMIELYKEGNEKKIVKYLESL